MGGKAGQSGRMVGFRSQPAGAASYTTIAFNKTDNRVKCPYCGGTWFQVKDTKTIDDGNLPTFVDGYGHGGILNMIIFLCHCGREFAKDSDIAAGNWSAQ